jgi:general secretion pathway protein G
MLDRKGFTLIELLIVIAVMAILVGIALPRFRGMQDSGNVAKAKGELRTLQTALESYYIHAGSEYPTTLTALETAIPQIVADSLPTDPFTSGNDYGYDKSTNGRYFVVYSIGPEETGSASVSDDGDVTEIGGASCIYATNTGETDTSP